MPEAIYALLLIGVFLALAGVGGVVVYRLFRTHG